MRKTYLFDLYGTLIDLHTNETKESLWRAMARLYSMHGANYTTKELKSLYSKLRRSTMESSLVYLREKYNDPSMGLVDVEVDLDAIFKEMYARKGVSASDELIEFTSIAFRSISMSYIHLFDGVIPMLDRLHEKGCKAYLLSNAQASFTHPEVMSLGLLDKLDGILYSSDVGVKKPSKYFYNELITRFGLDKNDCIMVGNEYEADVIGSHNYGIPSIWVHTQASGKGTGPLPEGAIEIHDIRDVCP